MAGERGRVRLVTPRLAMAGRGLAFAAQSRPDGFYQSRRWGKLARSVKEARGYRCEECGVDKSDDPRGLIADHVCERKDGGADLDPGNIRLLCAACHNAKSAAARLTRVVGSGGWPRHGGGRLPVPTPRGGQKSQP